jgi:UDP-N-acetylmuramoylalanine--D-glutamate ligase
MMVNMLGEDYFAGKKITVLGLGLLGRGVGDVAYMAEAGAAEILVTDKKTREELATSVAQIEHYPNVKLVLGEHHLEDFEGRDLVIVAAGVPLDSPFVQAAKDAGSMIAQSAALFALISNIPIIGITGTRGKSTVTHMIHHVLSVTFDGPVLLGGNVRGLSNLQLLKQVTADAVAVMELDSWQLQGFGWAKRSPEVAVFTNFMTDHMNYYHGDMEAYFADKANIFKYQDDNDTLVMTPEVFEWAKKTPGLALGQEVILVDASIIPEDSKLAMPGEHNRLNAALAYKALEAMGLSEEEIFAGLASFPGVEGRLQYLGEYRDIKIYNDNNATTPQAVVMGLRAVGNRDDKNIILIAGGAKKDIDPQVLVDEIPYYCKQVILLEGTGTDQIKDLVVSTVVPSIETAIEAALAEALPGDTILFSPGFASFGMFKNEYERNDEFVSLIKKL